MPIRSVPGAVTVIAIFGLMALLLAAAIPAVMSYALAQRRRVTKVKFDLRSDR